MTCHAQSIPAHVHGWALYWRLFCVSLTVNNCGDKDSTSHLTIISWVINALIVLECFDNKLRRWQKKTQRYHACVCVRLCNVMQITFDARVDLLSLRIHLMSRCTGTMILRRVRIKWRWRLRIKCSRRKNVWISALQTRAPPRKVKS